MSSFFSEDLAIFVLPHKELKEAAISDFHPLGFDHFCLIDMPRDICDGWARGDIADMGSHFLVLSLLVFSTNDGK